jgi:hypothetical protein
MAILAGSVAAVALLPTLSSSVRSVPRPAEWTRPSVDERVVQTV